MACIFDEDFLHEQGIYETIPPSHDLTKEPLLGYYNGVYASLLSEPPLYASSVLIKYFTDLHPIRNTFLSSLGVRTLLYSPTLLARKHRLDAIELVDDTVKNLLYDDLDVVQKSLYEHLSLYDLWVSERSSKKVKSFLEELPSVKMPKVEPLKALRKAVSSHSLVLRVMDYPSVMVDERLFLEHLTRLRKDGYNVLSAYVDGDRLYVYGYGKRLSQQEAGLTYEQVGNIYFLSREDVSPLDEAFHSLLFRSSKIAPPVRRENVVIEKEEDLSFLKGLTFYENVDPKELDDFFRLHFGDGYKVVGENLVEWGDTIVDVSEKKMHHLIDSFLIAKYNYQPRSEDDFIQMLINKNVSLQDLTPEEVRGFLKEERINAFATDYVDPVRVRLYKDYPSPIPLGLLDPDVLKQSDVCLL